MNFDSYEILVKERLETNELVIYLSNENDKNIKNELFTSVIPIIVHENKQELKKYLDFINDPLAIYIYGRKEDWIDQYIYRNTRSGQVVRNEAINFVGDKRVPFGGIGISGLGNYRGVNSIYNFAYPRVYVDSKNFVKMKTFEWPRNKDKTNLIKRFIK